METELIKTLRRNKMITGVLLLCLGVALILWPTSALATLAKVAGFFLMVYAVAGIINFAFGNKGASAIITLIIDIAGAILGLYLFLNPEWFIGVSSILFGVIILIHGIHNLYDSVTVVRKLDTGWKNSLIFSIVVVVLGLFIIANPFDIPNLIVRIIGVVLVINAVLAFYNMSRMKM